MAMQEGSEEFVSSAAVSTSVSSHQAAISILSTLATCEFQLKLALMTQVVQSLFLSLLQFY